MSETGTHVDRSITSCNTNTNLQRTELIWCINTDNDLMVKHNCLQIS